MRQVLLIMGDEAEIAIVRQSLESAELHCRAVNTVDQALIELEHAPQVMLVIDLDYLGRTVDRLLSRLRELDQRAPLLMISSRPEDLVSDGLVESEDWVWINRPIMPRQLIGAADRLLGSMTGAGPDDAPRPAEAGRIIGRSAAIRRVLDLVDKVAGSGSAVLISGESGTGKELVAAAIHRSSPRRRQAFVAVNCAALHENLLESELFGHEKGAFTGAYRRRIGRFEQANGGTLFLDEVGDMSLSTQAKVLRVIQLQEFERLGGVQKVRVNVRIVAATNKDLRASIARGAFREDLFYRLNVFPLNVPPLRERIEDVPLLAEHFIVRYAGAIGRRGLTLSAAAIEALRNHPWPGNVRELENVIERAVLVCTNDQVQPEDLLLESAAENLAPQLEIGRGLPLIPESGVDLEQVERGYVLAALRRARGKQREAARLLGVSPRVMHYKIRKHQIDPTELE